MKTCTNCNEKKELKDFYKNPRGRAGRRNVCKSCMSGAHKKRTYGMTQEEYDELWAFQGGVCFICQKPETAINNMSNKVQKLAIDHSHKTGKVRYLICNNCNRALGMFQDDPKIIQSAIDYLEAFKEVEEV